MWREAQKQTLYWTQVHICKSNKTRNLAIAEHRATHWGTCNGVAERSKHVPAYVCQR